MTKTTLTDKEIRDLIKAQIALKQAEDKLADLKDKYLGDLEPGIYTSESGRILKTLKTSSKTDWNKMLADNPQINKEDYTTTKEIVSICIRNDMIKGII